MAEPVLIDVDVAFKVCIYRSGADLLACTNKDQPPALLSISQFTLRSRARRVRGLQNIDGTIEEIENLIAKITFIQPTEAEIAMAADFEEDAAQCSLEFDTGESQLLAVLLSRRAPLLVTGDKRAIQALHDLDVSGIDGRIACFEQLMASILARCEPQTLRERICREPCADRAMTSCFACSSLEVSAEEIQSGLSSYVNHLRSCTSTLLLSSTDLSAVVT